MRSLEEQHDEPPGKPGDDAAAVVVEAGVPLSRSLLWRLQRAYFDRVGIAAWSTSTVPHRITNNPAIAQAYAAVVLGFLRDCRASAPDPAAPPTLVELGAGSGRFAYLFLRALTDLVRRSPLAGARFRYVMTDFTDTNIDHWRAHPSLQPYVEQGVLDFARFDVEQDHELRLLHAGVTLSPGSMRSPLGVIANYVFDGIAQDAFSFEGAELQEHLVTLSSPGPAIDLADPALLGRLTLRTTRRPAPRDPYEEPALNATLRGYAGRMDGKTFLFPSAALRGIGRLAALANGQIFLLSGDRGDIRLEGVAQSEGLGMTRHGSVSFDVNYHAIASHVLAAGGSVLQTSSGHKGLHVSAYLLGEGASGWLETRLAFEQAIERGGPDEIFMLRGALHGNYEHLLLGHLLSLIQLSGWDPQVVHDALPGLWKRLPEASDDEAQQVVRTVMRAWENHYPIDEPDDLAFELALLVHGYGGYAEALALFEASARLHGDNPKTRWNAGLCHYAMGALDAAVACFAEARRLAPDFVPVGAVQVNE